MNRLEQLVAGAVRAGAGGSEVGSQPWLEAHRCTPHLRFHGSERQAEARRDLLVTQLVASVQHEDLTAPARELGDGPPDGVVELAAQTFVLRGVRHGWLFVAGALDPRRHNAPMPQVLERPVPRRAEQEREAQVTHVGGGLQLREWDVSYSLIGCTIPCVAE